MKKLIPFLFFVFAFHFLQAQVKFTALNFTPAYPQAGGNLHFDFNKKSSPLISEPGANIVVYQFTDKGLKVSEPTLTRKGEVFSGSVTLEKNVNLVAFGISHGEEKDNNKTKGYIIPVYTNSKVPVKGYYSAANNMYNGYGEYLFGMTNDPEKGLAITEEGLTAYPELRSDAMFMGGYINSLSRVKKDDAKPMITALVNETAAKKNLSEDDYNIMATGYARLKNKEKAEEVKKELKAAYPNGKWKKSEAGMAFNKEKDADKKLELYNAYMATYPPTDEDKFLVENYKSQMANAYANAGKYGDYEKWNSLVSAPARASNNNSISWSMGKEDKELAKAKEISYAAALWAKNEMQRPTEKKPDASTQTQWKDQRENTYGMYADTYAYILYKMGDYKAGFHYAREAATISKLKDADLNERYALLAAKVLPTAEAEALVEKFVKEGTASAATKEALKSLYITSHKSENGYAEYLAKLEADAREKKKEEIAKSMINEPAPVFNLKDFEGKNVSLADLKGKVVIVDFWATWCGPCIASMPGMNKALAKYKDNENVKFLFVDTWETAENKLDNAQKFMEKKNYPFYVLMDTEDKMVSDFKVSGIPTKFVLDKNGNIRFKAVGYSGKEDELVDEIDTMIELAAK
ncbi:MAG: TlpA disulfide reductase family protein [Ferruginibacter sp.]